MIVEATTLLLTGLNAHINTLAGNPVGSPDIAILGNAGLMDDQQQGAGLQNRILLSLLNVEEEAALKNGPTTFVEAGGVTVRHRPVHLNLHLMFAANFDSYQTALDRLGQTITYFQGKKKFDPASFPAALPGLPPGTDLLVTMELVTLSLEELSFVWGAHGGREVPFATYRARLVRLEDRRPADGAGEIRDIDIRLEHATTTAAGAN